MPEAAAIFQIECFNAGEEASDGFLGCNAARGEVGHAGLDESGVKDRNGDALGFEVMGQGFPSHGKGHFGHAIAIGSTGAIVFNGAHAASHEGDFRPLAEAREKSFSEVEGGDRVHLKLPSQAVQVQIAEAKPLHDGGVIDQNVDGLSLEFGC